MKNNLVKLVLAIFLIFVFQQGNSQETLILQPDGENGKDAVVLSLYPDSTLADFPCWWAAAWTYNGDFGICRSLVEFDFSELPENSEILSAHFSCYDYSSCGHDGSAGENQSLLRRITSEWEEDQVTWNNMPDVTYNNLVENPIVEDGNDLINVDVTLMLFDAITESEDFIGFELKIEDESIYKSLCFGSSDNSDPELRPKLEIVYNNSSNTPENISGRSEKLFSIYPNPVTENLTIEFDIFVPDQVMIFNEFGKNVLQKKITAQTNNGTIDILMQGLSPGIYLVRIESDNKIFEEKIIKI